MGDEYLFSSPDGRPLDSIFELEREGDEIAIIVNSAGGGYNSDYNQGLEILILALSRVRAAINRVVLDTLKTQEMGLSPEERTLLLPYPIKPWVSIRDSNHEARKLRLQIARRMQSIGQEPEAKGGNNQKRIRVYISDPSPEKDLDAISKTLSGVSAKEMSHSEPSVAFSIEEEAAILACNSVGEVDELGSTSDWSQDKTAAAIRRKFNPLETEGENSLFDRYMQVMSNKLDRGDATEEPPSSLLRREIESCMQRLINRAPLRRRQTGRSGYGLVVGRVQSGKTSHMLGLSCLALDPARQPKPHRYDTVIVLSGLIEDLRIQTAERVEKLRLHPLDVTPNSNGKDLTDNPQALEEISAHFANRGSPDPMVIVCKKNHIVLRDLAQKISESTKRSRKRRVLVIDDECDHASVDSTNSESTVSAREQQRITATNHNLRALLSTLQARTRPGLYYVGYTATPYSNLLMRPDPQFIDPNLGHTLFPRDFIYTLEQPRGHIDNELYFLVDRGNNNIVTMEIDEHDHDQEARHCRDLYLLHALTWLMKSETPDIDRDVGDSGFHHTTLIHTDIQTSEHRRIVELLMDAKQDLELSKMDSICSEMRDLASEYYSDIDDGLMARVETKLGGMDEPSFRRLMGIAIVELNRREEDDDAEDESEYRIPHELKYGSSTPKSVIVVGGTRVARGLTLEGLTVTWFARIPQTPNYDTLLQMSRWCGYRKGYAQLVRLFLDQTLQDWFENIANVEYDLRTDLLTMDDSSDPIEDVVWIRRFEGMEITGRMPEDPQIRTSGRVNRHQVWTYWPPVFFSSNPKAANIRCWKTFERLHRRIDGGSDEPPKSESNYRVALGVSSEWVADFLRRYSKAYSQDTNTKSGVEDILGLILEGELPRWNIAIHQPVRRTTASFGDWKLVDRSSPEPNKIQPVHSGTNTFEIDLEEGQERETPLLVVYLANHNYEVHGHRVFPEGMTRPVVLFGIIRPDDGDSGSIEEVAGPRE